MDRAPRRVPVIALTGHLGAGKTTVLNHLLRRPGARIGVIINDFGAINVDAALVSGQIDQAASISGGCLCCLDDSEGFDAALEKLTHPRLALDAVIVEASGIAEPGALARMIRFSGAEHARPGGVVDVVDAVEHFATVDPDGRGVPPARYAVTSLVAINKCDLVPAEHREEHLTRIEARVREANPQVHVVRIERGRLDPELVHDVAALEDPPDQLPLGALLREEHERHDGHGHGHGHGHAAYAASVSVSRPGPIEPGALLDLLEDPPAGAYRMKGTIAVRAGAGTRGYVVHVVGRSLFVASHPAPATSDLVAIGVDLDPEAVRPRLEAAMVPAEHADTAALRRLQRWRRLSL